jgi:hypothetical protein
MLDFEKRVAKNDTRKKKPKKWSAPRRPGVRRGRRFQWQYAVLIAGAILFVVTLPSNTNLTELPPDQVMSWSPVLVAASLSPPPPRPPHLLLGQVNKSRWALMSAQQRRASAQQLADKMKQQNIEAATVMMEGQVVMQIERGTLLMVQ